VIRFESSGGGQTEKFLSAILSGEIGGRGTLERLAQEGVNALMSATPKGVTGRTATGWAYEIIHENGMYTIWWVNNHIVDGFVVAIGLQYGHGTGGGGWVSGYDYINPAIRPIMNKIADEVWKEVQKA
jgi:hypothetical protein